MNVSVIVVTFNQKRTSNSSLMVKWSQEIIVVDNASKNKSFSKKKISNVIVISNNKNLGFARACNQGVKIAKGEYLLFLNPDTVVKKDFFEKLENFVKKERVDIVGFKTLNKDGTLQFSCGNFPTILNIVLDRIPLLSKIFSTELIRKENYYKDKQYPDWVSGACLLVRRDVYEKLKGFDEKYFLYVEDIDLCLRAKMKGYQVCYNPNLEIIHLDEGKTEKKKDFKAKQIRIGFTIFFAKYRSSLYVSIWKTILLIESFFKPKLRN